jgi:guanylate kinase
VSSGLSGQLIVLSGPSGVGKGSVVARARELMPELWVSVSWATRAPRPGEVDGVAYHFVDTDRFREEIARGGFLEYAEYAGHLKGTPRQAVEDRIAAGVPTLLEIDLQGARQVRAAMPDARLVFLSPPDDAELARRLAGRGTESAEQISHRMRIAAEEMAARDEFDDVIVNDTIERAAQRLVGLLKSCR